MAVNFIPAEIVFLIAPRYLLCTRLTCTCHPPFYSCHLSSSRVQVRTTPPQLSPPPEFSSTLRITARLSVTPVFVFVFPLPTTPFLETVETALKEPMGRRPIQDRLSYQTLPRPLDLH